MRRRFACSRPRFATSRRRRDFILSRRRRTSAAARPAEVLRSTRADSTRVRSSAPDPFVVSQRNGGFARVQELPAHPLAIWENFYVIIGSSAAALTGLNFLVVAFVADRRKHISPRTLSAFSTPGIIHFCAVLFIAATLSAPWQRVAMVTVPLIALGIGG